MDSNRCPTCLFGDICSEEFTDCDFYFPIGESSEDAMLDARMNEEYLIFIEEWIEYTDEEIN